MSGMFFIDSLSFAVFKLIGTSVEFGSDAPRSCVLYHNFPSMAFVAVRSDGSLSEFKVVDFVYKRVGVAAIDVFAMPSAMLMDQYPEDSARLAKDGLLNFGERCGSCRVEVEVDVG
jgi:hypothetical protein